MCSKLLLDKRIGELNPEQQKILGTLNDEIARLSKITNELLDLSQVETGNIKLAIKTTTPADVVTRALEAVQFQAEQKNVSFETIIDRNLPNVQVDPDKTTWVIINFLTNAIRYSPENSQVKVSCQAESGHVRLSVKDSGPGIEKKYIAKIFDRFFKIPGASARGGTGLGLAISKEFIEAQKGEIGVVSEFGDGSEFFIRIPAS
jgi:two-component system, NtrC family, sensor histidine kinase KinB